MTAKETLANHPIARNDDYLAERLAQIWYHHFSDIAQPNDVVIRFGRKSKTRLGSIGMPGWQDRHHEFAYWPREKADQGTSVITITGYFRDERVPNYVIDATIGHELVHYAHGFHSPHPQLHRYPHQGGVVDKEMRERRMGEILKRQKQWLKKEWQGFTQSNRRRRRRHYVSLSFLPAYQRTRG